jgi:hypothetical protein
MSATPLLPLLLAIFFQRDVPMNGANRQRRTRSNDAAGKDDVKIGCDIRRLSEKKTTNYFKSYSYFSL